MRSSVGVDLPMLLTLRHLMLTLLVFTSGSVVAVLLAQHSGMLGGLLVLYVFSGGALALLGLSWPLYRLMHLRPIGLPFCLHCGGRHGNYHVPADVWPCGILICGACGKPTRFYMSRKKPPGVNDDMPTLYLYWPEFVGFWRTVDGHMALPWD